MFSYYGSKSKIAKYYPAPNHLTIVEPFAGSARYSLRWFWFDVTLIEKDEKVFAVWDFLQKASSRDILSLPDVENGVPLNSLPNWQQMSDGERYLIGFCSNGGSSQPKNVSGRHNFNSWNRDKKRISESLHKIRHWNIIQGDYEVAPDIDGTWFIDPPYQIKGKWYKHHEIDYPALAAWSKSRKGQVMVCENEGADWLPFVHLRDIPFTHFKSQSDLRRKTSEAVYYKEKNG